MRFDPQSPGLDGMQTGRALRMIKPNRPVIGLTGHISSGYVAQAAACGMTGQPRPVVLADLLQEARRALPSV